MKKITALLLCLSVLVCLLAACGTVSPKAALDKQFSALKEGNYTELGIFASGDSFTEEDQTMMKAMFKKLSYKLGDETVDGDKATVNASISMVDISEIFTNYLMEAFSHMSDTEEWDADETAFYDMIAAEDAPAKDFDVQVHMTKTEDGWAVDEKGNDDLINAITGGFFKYLSELADEFAE